MAAISRGGWKTALARLGAAVFLAGGLTVVTGGPSQASVLHCGEVITASTTLASDLLNCPDNGIVIGADNITVDLNGHVIAGDGTPVPSCPADLTCDVGVENTAGHSHVTITGGSIRRFDTGVALLIHDPALSYAEISARLGIPVGNIGPTRRRCLDKLRRDPAIAALVNADT